MSIDLLRSSFGFYGLRLISSSATVGSSVVFQSIQALEDSTVSFTSNGASENNQSSFSSFTMPKGAIVFGDFTGVSVSAGRVVGYLKG